MTKNNVAATVVAGICASMLMLGLAACEKKGPAEKAGEQLDHAAESVKETGDKAANEVEKAADKVEEAAK